MVLRKPYAFVIKHFKLIHLILFGLMIILVANTLTTMSFLNNFLNSNLAYITKADFNGNFSISMLLIPVVVLAAFIGLLSLMYMKKKPIVFYLAGSIGMVAVFAYNLYTRSIMASMITTMQSVQTVKMVSDFQLFFLLIDIFILLTCFIRGIGFNISRFDFNTDLTEMIEENDNEEVEFQFDLDMNDIKRNSNKRKRQLHYFYKENENIIKMISIALAVILALFGLKTLISSGKTIKRGSVSYNGFTLKVIDSYILNTDVKNNKFEDDIYLITIKTSIKNESHENKEIFKVGTLSLNLDGDIFKIAESRSLDVQDIGENYVNNEFEPQEEKEYLLTFAVPKNHIKSKKYLGIRDLNERKTTYIKINPKKLYGLKNVKVESEIGKSISLKDSTLKDTEFTISSIAIKERFKINYKFKYQKDEKWDSWEYVVPKVLDKNIDKALMQINIKYNNKNSKDIEYLIKNFGSFEYEVNGNKYTQTTGFNRVVPTVLNSNEVYFIEVNKNMINADKITLVLNIRNYEYRYKLK